MGTDRGLECGVVRGDPSKFYFKIPVTYRNHSSTHWSCQARADKSNMASLDVWYPPAINSLTANAVANRNVVNVNDTVSLVCRYEGNPPADVIIRKQSRSLQTVVGDVAVRSTLTTVSCHDMATYVCQASNRFGSASSTIRLLVRCPPTQGASQGTTTTSLEGDVTLTLTVMAYPRPTFTWFGPLGNLLDANNGSLDANLNVISRITIKDVTDDDLGVYTVIVKNDLGSGNFTVALATEDPVSGGLVAGIVLGGIAILVIVADPVSGGLVTGLVIGGIAILVIVADPVSGGLVAGIVLGGIAILVIVADPVRGGLVAGLVLGGIAILVIVAIPLEGVWWPGLLSAGSPFW
ncbi:netrin receptor unc-40-like isoform X4 [Haliotis rufescens]|uniref:netrin receptor unc-40-like isoform X4 n=1 Tax=Haliotis rufescens TaxID=6454 RepID=UPI00201E8433|nr:netrin receptor unc-40-like isoform X4 [Haliotis rufescens]